MGKAIEYTYTLLPRLFRYVSDGRIEIDDNRIENAIRSLALGRKNYLFCRNDASAYRAAIVYSLIATCKSAEVDPRIWWKMPLAKSHIMRGMRRIWKNFYHVTGQNPIKLVPNRYHQFRIDYEQHRFGTNSQNMQRGFPNAYPFSAGMKVHWPAMATSVFLPMSSRCSTLAI